MGGAWYSPHFFLTALRGGWGRWVWRTGGDSGAVGILWPNPSLALWARWVRLGMGCMGEGLSDVVGATGAGASVTRLGRAGRGARGEVVDSLAISVRLGL